MKKLKWMIMIGMILLLASTVLSGCSARVGNGRFSQKEVVLPKVFAGVKTLSPIDVVVDASISGTAYLEAESNVLEWVDVTDEDGVIVVKFKNKTLIIPTKPVKLHIPYFSGGLLETSSLGSITMSGEAPLKGDVFSLLVNSSGSIHVTVEARELHVRSSSNGSITAEGQADNAFIEISRMGSYKGFDCQIQNARVQLSSIGSAQVNVTGELSGNTSSLGRITYDGDPENINVTGSAASHR